VLAEYVARTRNDVQIYTRWPDEPDRGAPVHRLPPSEPAGLTWLARTPRRGRQAAAAMDAGGHDVALCFPSIHVQAPEVLPYLRLPSLYYAPETLRAQLEPEPEFGRATSLKATLARRGLNPYERLRLMLNHAAIRAADRVVTHSQFTRRQLLDHHGVDADVVLLGVDAEALTPADVPREGYVLAVGALHPLKGHQFVIEALATLDPRPRLVLVGDRGIGPELEQLARERGVELDLRREVPDVLDLYRRAGVLACGQIREPFGLTPLEAMATGTPVVAVAEGGFLETIRDGETGLLVERDAVAFGQAIRRVLDDRELAERLGTAGRAEVEREWGWQRTVEAWDALLEDLVHG
jgi:glycosyltransferase involved in cell wall biosynthesis